MVPRPCRRKGTHQARIEGMADADLLDAQYVRERRFERLDEVADPNRTDDFAIMHASSVAFNGRAVLILGPSGSGKSGLALELMSRGAKLVSDDGTRVAKRRDRIELSAPENVAGKIEARHFGILKSASVSKAELAVVVDLSRPEPERLPHPRTINLLGAECELVFGASVPNLPAALIQYLKGGRAD